MKKKITQLDEHTDIATNQMLLLLIQKKLKYSRSKKIHFTILCFAVAYIFFIFNVIYKKMIKPSDASILDIFSFLLTNNLFLALIIVGAILLGATKILFDKKEKAEKEFHDLRCEIIDKSKDLWKEEAWKQRYKVFETLKNEYDINLYHQSK